MRHAAHQHRFVVGREKRRQLQDILLQHDVQGRSLVEVLHGQHPSEDAVDVALGVYHRHVLTAYHDETVALLPAVLHARHHILLRNRLAGDHLIAHIAQGAVGGDIAVD